jgi:hypothetical protein
MEAAMNRVVTLATALAALAGLGSVRAHHSVSMFDLAKPIWIKGTVVSFAPVNPHVLFTLEERQSDGQVRLWKVEGPGLNSFRRRGLSQDLLQPGDALEVCGFGFKEEVLARNGGLDANGRSRPGLHGHLLVSPDGQMRRFGGYGKLDNCVRPDDSVQDWVTFLNADRVAGELWCNGRAFMNFPSLAPKAFVADVDRQLANPCSP